MSTSATARMPRAQRRNQLLELATRVFTEKGYQATSMDDIAAAAGVTKPVLYQHFSSKQSLYIEVLDIIAESMLEEVRALGEFQGDTSSRVRSGLQRFYRFVAMDNSLRLFTGHEMVNEAMMLIGHEVISEAVQERVVIVLDRLAIALAGVLTAFRQLSIEESRILGHGLIAVTQTTAQLLHSAEDEAARETILHTMTTTVVHGLTGFPALENPRSSEVVLGADTEPGSSPDA